MGKPLTLTSSEYAKDKAKSQNESLSSFWDQQEPRRQFCTFHTFAHIRLHMSVRPYTHGCPRPSVCHPPSRLSGGSVVKSLSLSLSLSRSLALSLSRSLALSLSRSLALSLSRSLALSLSRSLALSLSLTLSLDVCLQERLAAAFIAGELRHGCTFVSDFVSLAWPSAANWQCGV